MAKRLSVVNVVEDEASWNQWMEKNDQLLLVVEVYKGWCGPCEVMEPTLKRIYLDYSRASDRMAFLAVKSDIVASVLPADCENPSCKPLFLFYKMKQIVGKVMGANAPEITALVNDNIPPEPEDN